MSRILEGSKEAGGKPGIAAWVFKSRRERSEVTGIREDLVDLRAVLNYLYTK
jgi:hypothetical protein